MIYWGKGTMVWLPLTITQSTNQKGKEEIFQIMMANHPSKIIVKTWGLTKVCIKKFNIYIWVTRFVFRLQGIHREILTHGYRHHAQARQQISQYQHMMNKMVMRGIFHINDANQFNTRASCRHITRKTCYTNFIHFYMFCLMASLESYYEWVYWLDK